MARVTGIDVSHYQGIIDWDKVRRSRRPRIGFAYIKATDGETFEDPAFRRNWRGAHRVGIPVGAYHFIEEGDGAAQGRHFAQVVHAAGGYGAFDLPPAADWERAEGDVVSDFARQVHRSLTRPTVLYSGHWAREHGGGKRECRWLWTPHYGGPPILFDPWDRWTFWQYSSGGAVPGIEGRVDMDRFHGGRLAWWWARRVFRYTPP